MSIEYTQEQLEELLIEASRAHQVATGSTRKTLEDIKLSNIKRLSKSFKDSWQHAKFKSHNEFLAFIAQCSKETGGFAKFKEVVSSEPTDIFMRGRGLIQLTQRETYEDVNKEMRKKGILSANQDILTHPELVSDDFNIATISAFFYWQLPKKKLSTRDYDKITDIDAATKTVLGQTQDKAPTNFTQRKNIFLQLRAYSLSKPLPDSLVQENDIFKKATAAIVAEQENKIQLISNKRIAKEKKRILSAMAASSLSRAPNYLKIRGASSEIQLIYGQQHFTNRWSIQYRNGAIELMPASQAITVRVKPWQFEMQVPVDFKKDTKAVFLRLQNLNPAIGFTILTGIFCYITYKYMTDNPLIKAIDTTEKNFLSAVRQLNNNTSSNPDNFYVATDAYLQALDEAIVSNILDADKIRLTKKKKMAAWIKAVIQGYYLLPPQPIDHAVVDKVQLILEELQRIAADYEGFHPAVLSRDTCLADLRNQEIALNEIEYFLSGLVAFIKQYKKEDYYVKKLLTELQTALQLKDLLLNCNKAYRTVYQTLAGYVADCLRDNSLFKQPKQGWKDWIKSCFVKSSPNLLGDDLQLSMLYKKLAARAYYALTVNLYPGLQNDKKVAEIDQLCQEMKAYLDHDAMTADMALNFALEYLAEDYIENYPFNDIYYRDDKNNRIRFSAADMKKSARKDFYYPQHKIIETIAQYRNKPINTDERINSVLLLLCFHLISKHPSQVTYEHTLFESILSNYYTTLNEPIIESFFLAVSPMHLIHHPFLKKITQKWDVQKFKNKYILSILLTLHPEKMISDNNFCYLIKQIDDSYAIGKFTKQNRQFLLKAMLIAVNYHIIHDPSKLQNNNEDKQLLPDIERLFNICAEIDELADYVKICQNNWQCYQKDIKESLDSDNSSDEDDEEEGEGHDNEITTQSNSNNTQTNSISDQSSANNSKKSASSFAGKIRNALRNIGDMALDIVQKSVTNAAVQPAPISISGTTGSLLQLTTEISINGRTISAFWHELLLIFKQKSNYEQIEELLLVLGLLASEKIEEAWLIQLMPDQVQRHEIFSLLERYGLLYKNQQKLFIDPMLQHAICENFSSQVKNKTITKLVLFLLNLLLPNDNVGEFYSSLNILPHLLSLYNNSSNISLDKIDEIGDSLLINYFLSYFLHYIYMKIGDVENSQKFFIERCLIEDKFCINILDIKFATISLEINEKLFGKDHLLTLEAKALLGYILYNHGKMEKAKEIVVELLKTYQSRKDDELLPVPEFFVLLVPIAIAMESQPTAIEEMLAQYNTCLEKFKPTALNSKITFASLGTAVLYLGLKQADKAKEYLEEMLAMLVDEENQLSLLHATKFYVALTHLILGEYISAYNLFVNLISSVRENLKIEVSLESRNIEDLPLPAQKKACEQIMEKCGEVFEECLTSFRTNLPATDSRQNQPANRVTASRAVLYPRALGNAIIPTSISTVRPAL